MKFLFKILTKLLLVVLILGVIFVGVPLFLLHKKSAAPISDYTTANEAVFYQALDDDLRALMLDTNSDLIDLTVTEAFLNTVIQKELSKDNPKYLDETYKDTPDYRYMMMFSDQVGLKGVWTTLKDDLIKITVGADILLNGKTMYQTAISIDLKVVLNDGDTYLLQVKKIQVGKVALPIKQGVAITNFFVQKFQGKSLNELVVESLPFGAFDSTNLSFTVGEDELTDYLYTLDPSFAALLRIIYDEDLLMMDFTDQGFNLSLNLGIFRRLATDLDEVPFTKLEDQTEKDALMADIAARALISATAHPLNPYMDLTETDLNQILDYQLQDQVSFEFPLDFMLNGVKQEYMFKSTNLYIRMVGDQLSVHLKMTLEKVGFPGSFLMQFSLFTTVDIDASGNMVLTILNSHIGDIVLDTAMLKTMIDTFNPNLMVGQTLVIPKEKLNEMFAGAGITFNEGYVLNGALRLHFGIDS